MTASENFEIIAIGSGIGGLTAGALLARYGKRVLVCESHSIPGGAVHSFTRPLPPSALTDEETSTRREFHFDSGASFYCGLDDRRPSRNPLRQVLDVLGESLSAVSYDPLGEYHFPEGRFSAYGNLDRYREEVARFSPQGAKELATFHADMLALYESLREIPAIALRADWQAIPWLVTRYFPSLLKSLPQLGAMRATAGEIMDRSVRDPWVRRLIDLECFLLSGLKAHSTIAPEVAFMLGERSRGGVEYPLGGSGAIAAALVRGLERWGGRLRLRSRVERILVESGQAVGVRLANGDVLRAPIVISNASVWDTYGNLLAPEDLPSAYRREQLATPAIASFVHLHLGIRAAGLEHLDGHHVVLRDGDRDLTEPGNTCMISIPTVWDPRLAPDNHHAVHAYTLEPYAGWQRDRSYAERKRERSQGLYNALDRVIPDLESRSAVELVGTPLTHARFLNRYHGTYGPAIDARHGMFPSCHTPIAGLYRVGDSTLPGIGVPAAAASGILCANALVPLHRMTEVANAERHIRSTS